MVHVYDSALSVERWSQLVELGRYLDIPMGMSRMLTCNLQQLKGDKRHSSGCCKLSVPVAAGACTLGHEEILQGAIVNMAMCSVA